MRRVLITGGAGFIGSHVADALIARGDTVRVLDCLDPQVHGTGARPDYLHEDAELVVGDVRDAAAVSRALQRIDAVFHFAACVGVGQSMYAVEKYTSVNNVGTAVLLEALARHPVERLIVASSMSVYGEGLYRAPDGKLVANATRDVARLRAGQWDPIDEHGAPLVPVPTPETKTPVLESVYALSKYDQERLCLVLGRAYGIPTVALRFFNVFGPRQALSNPYTGVLAIFASRLLNDRAPIIFEDGLQRRDFVNVRDVARACVRALDVADASGQVFNVGSGRAVTIRQVAWAIAHALGKEIAPEITQQSRVGDVRHCVADIRLARRVLGYAPGTSLEAGIEELTAWLDGQQADDRVLEARAELSARGLTL